VATMSFIALTLMDWIGELQSSYLTGGN
jgi:hypothetical protein